MVKKTKAWFLYMLRCADGSLYTGVTTDLKERLKAHNSGLGAKYTRARLPVALAYSRRVGGRSAALRAEYALKQKTREDKLKLAETGIGARRRPATRRRKPRLKRTP